jgi:hypothetical protein
VVEIGVAIVLLIPFQLVHHASTLRLSGANIKHLAFIVNGDDLVVNASSVFNLRDNSETRGRKSQSVTAGLDWTGTPLEPCFVLFFQLFYYNGNAIATKWISLSLLLFLSFSLFFMYQYHLINRHPLASTHLIQDG